MGNHVFLFQNRFAPLVAAGRKRQTIRGMRKRVPQVGDTVDLRQWSGKPYRSPQVKLARGTVTGVAGVHISTVTLLIYRLESGDLCEEYRTKVDRDHFARADGFADWQDLLFWFEEEHGLPFSGLLTCWKPWERVA